MTNLKTEKNYTKYELCDNVTLNTRSGRQPYWTCCKHPRLFARNPFLAADGMGDESNYLYCRDMNWGGCPVFEPRRGGDNAKSQPDVPE